MHDPTLLINILAPARDRNMTTHTDPDTGAKTLFAETRRDALELVKRAKICTAYVAINYDSGIDVQVTKKAVREALAGDMDAPCGGILWLDDLTFRLDRLL